MTPPTDVKSRASGADLISRAKEAIEEVQPTEASAEATRAEAPATLVDVREQHEFEERHIEGAVHVPRGHLESRIEQLVPDRSGRVIVYCASGNRSALAARTMAEELG